VTSRRRFLSGVGGVAAVGLGLAGCGYRPGGGDIRWTADSPRGLYRSDRVDVTDDLVVTIADRTTSYDHDAAEFVHGGRVIAYGTDDGSERWRDTLAESLTCHAIGDGGAAVGFDGTLVRYGSEGRRWETEVGGSLVAVAVADGRGYAVSDAGELVACADGETRWRVDLDPALGSDAGGFEPAVAASAETVVCWVGGEVLGFDTEGRRRWRQSGINVRRFSFVDGRLFAAGGHGLAALDVSSGELRWLVEDGIGSFSVTTDAIYTAYDAEVRAYDHAGRRDWSTDGTDGGGRGVVDDTDYQGRVAADADGVFVDSSRGLTALDPADGSFRWRTENRLLTDGPYLADSGVLVVADDDLVCHYRADTF